MVEWRPLRSDFRAPVRLALRAPIRLAQAVAFAQVQARGSAPTRLCLSSHGGSEEDTVHSSYCPVGRKRVEGEEAIDASFRSPYLGACRRSGRRQAGSSNLTSREPPPVLPMPSRVARSMDGGQVVQHTQEAAHVRECDGHPAVFLALGEGPTRLSSCRTTASAPSSSRTEP
jgi:hypothetical protein